MYVIIKYLNKSLFCLELMKKHNVLVFSHKSCIKPCKSDRLVFHNVPKVIDYDLSGG